MLGRLIGITYLRGSLKILKRLFSNSFCRLEWLMHFHIDKGSEIEPGEDFTLLTLLFNESHL